MSINWLVSFFKKVYHPLLWAQQGIFYYTTDALLCKNVVSDTRITAGRSEL